MGAFQSNKDDKEHYFLCGIHAVFLILLVMVKGSCFYFRAQAYLRDMWVWFQTSIIKQV